MENELNIADNSYREEIIEGLQELGFTLNDARIYLTLLTLGVSNPAKIAEESGVDRARVYDSLKRLVKKNYIYEEAKKRAPQYRVVEPDNILEKIKTNLISKMELAENLKSKLKTVKTPQPETFVWTIEQQSIKRSLNLLIENAKTKLLFLVTPDISSNSMGFENLVGKLIRKKRDNPQISVSIALKIPNTSNATYLLKKMYKEEINVYRWESWPILPFGIYLSEQNVIFTILNSVTPDPNYNFGIEIEYTEPSIMLGFEHAIKWCYQNLCKKATISKKSSDKNTSNTRLP